VIEPQLLQISADTPLQLLERRAHEIGWEFLGADFEQKRVRHTTCQCSWRLYETPLR
jgi:hypothetical protein